MTGRDHRKLDAIRAQIDAATQLSRQVLRSLDDEYAFQEPDWQEGPSGQRSCRQSAALRARILALETLPGAEELG